MLSGHVWTMFTLAISAMNSVMVVSVEQYSDAREGTVLCNVTRDVIPSVSVGFAACSHCASCSEQRAEPQISIGVCVCVCVCVCVYALLRE